MGSAEDFSSQKLPRLLEHYCLSRKCDAKVMELLPLELLTSACKAKLVHTCIYDFRAFIKQCGLFD
jgi:hypothetical protein